MNPGTFTWTTWLPIFVSGLAVGISIVSLYWSIIVEKAKRRAKLEVWQRNHCTIGGDDERTKIQLIFRNLSPRPTAIIDVYVRRKDGGIVEGSGYKGRIELPIQIKAWGVYQAEFKIEKRDEKEIKDIFIRDIDDDEIVIDQSGNRKWVKKTLKKRG